MSAPMTNPIHSQSHPFRGKTIAYIKVVQGAKTKPAMPTSQDQLSPVKAKFTFKVASNQLIRNPKRGPKNIRPRKKQHIASSLQPNHYEYQLPIEIEDAAKIRKSGANGAVPLRTVQSRWMSPRRPGSSTGSFSASAAIAICAVGMLAVPANQPAAY